MKTFLGSDYSLVFFKLPNQLEGIVKKKTLLFEQFRRRRTWWYMAYLPPVGAFKPRPVAHFPTLKRDLNLFHGPFLP